MNSHFEEQLVSQAWELDTETESESMAVSGWKRVSADNDDIYGTLTILDLGSDNYQLEYKILLKNSNAAASVGSAVIIDRIAQ